MKKRRRNRRNSPATLRSWARPWVRLLSRLYDELQATRMLQRDPADILSRASDHLDQQHRPLAGEDLKLHLVTLMFISAIALDDQTNSHEGNLARTLKKAVLDYLDGNFGDNVLPFPTRMPQ